MIRETISQQFDHDPNFRWRGTDVTRIENLSDIVFALALGMIVSATTPPQSFSDLQQFLFSIVPVTAAFAILIGIWHDHFTSFRRFGLADKRIIFYNAILLLVVLYVAYPLRFAFDSFFSFMMGLNGDFTRIERMELTFDRSGIILGYFAIGYGVIQFLLALMYRYAISKRDLLELTPSEYIEAKVSLFDNYTLIAISVCVACAAMLTPLYGFAGCLYFLSWPITAFTAKKLKSTPPPT